MDDIESDIVTDSYEPDIVTDSYEPDIVTDSYKPDIVTDSYTPDIVTDSNEPDIVKYEGIPLPEEEKEPGTSEEDKSSSSSDDDFDVPEGRPISPGEDKERAQKLRSETIDTILDCVVTPRRVERDGKPFVLRLSRQQPSRDEIRELSEKFEIYLRERQVKMQGYCPIRRELYDLLFDELIRQSTLFCPERGTLLLRVRDEFRMTLAAYEKLYENGVEYGTRKALEAEVETQKLNIQHSQLEDEVVRAERKIQQLKAEIEAEEKLSQDRIDMKQQRHEEKMEFLRKANKQLKEQLSMVT